MNVSTMRWVDKWGGAPLCLLLTVVRKFLDVVRPTPPGSIRRILFVKPAEQGTTVLAYPAIRNAVEMVGRENVYFLCFQENRFILDIMDVIPRQNVITISTRNIGSFIASAVAAVRRTRKEAIDAAIDFEFFAHASAALAYLSGANRRVGFHAFAGEASYRGDLMTHRLSYNPHIHTAEAFPMMVEALNRPVDDLPAFDLEQDLPDHPLPQFHPSPQEVDDLRKVLLAETGREAVPPLILLNANCSDMLPQRRWPAERYIELARRLIDAFPSLYVAFTGRAEEAGYARQLVQKVNSDRCFCVAGKTSLRQLLVLYTVADVLVTNDSGPAHFAAVTPIDVITLFGPETPALYGSKSSRNHIMWSALPCSPCVNAYNDRLSPCRNNICLQRISVDQVFETVCEVYPRRH